jgi:hypothetical protein
MATATDTPSSVLSQTLWPVMKTALCLLEWVETTHGNEFGHDHHCPLRNGPEGPWVDEPGDPDVCSCGWSLFRLAYDEYSGGEPRRLDDARLTVQQILATHRDTAPEPTGSPS